MSSSPANKVSLRPFCTEDEELLFVIYAGTRRDEVSQWGWGAAQQEAFLRMQFNAQTRGYEATYPHADHQMICLDGRPIGRIMVYHASDHMLLVDIALLPDYQHRGIGSGVLRDLAAHSDHTRVSVRLRVHKINAGARRLYDRLGFVQTGEDEIYFQLERAPI